jgi:hypothetical protein
VILARKRNQQVVAESESLDAEQIRRRLDMFDQRLDNIDSMVTAIVERIMNQVVTLNMNCPRCGNNMEIAIIGSKKPTV